jgi:hypothetical protein
MSERRLGRSIAARLQRLEGEPERTADQDPPPVPPEPALPEHATTAKHPPLPTQPSPATPAPSPKRDPARSPAGALICSNCGTANVPGDAFCVNCGSFLDWSGQAEHDAGPAPAASAAVPAADSATVSAPKPSAAQDRSAQPGDLICANCGEPNDPSRKFCRRCGSSLATASTASAPPPPPAAPPSLDDLADYLTAYVPTWVVSLFLPLWGALIAAEVGGTEFGQPFKLAIAIATAVTAGMWVWGEGYQTARRAATSRRGRRRRVRPFDALRVGAWEVGAAAIAAFAWATAAPFSWASFSSAFWPLATVIGAAVILGVAGKFFAPLEGAR